MGLLNQDTAIRPTVDPVTQVTLNKAAVVIGVGANGEMYHFESETTFQKYSSDFVRAWRRELAFDPVKSPYTAEVAHMGNTAYSAFMGEGAVADIATNAENEIFVSVGTFDGERLDEDRRGDLNQWIDVFDADGTHLARLLEDELPPFPSRRGYEIDVHDGRLLVLGGTELWVYDLIREP